MDSGARKFGVTVAFVTAAVAAGQFGYALGAVALYTVANVLLKLYGPAE